MKAIDPRHYDIIVSPIVTLEEGHRIDVTTGL